MDDADLLRRWRDGDAKAGSALLRRYFDNLFRFFASKVDDEVDDLIQATMLACVRYQESFEKAASFKAYLFTVARNQLYRHLRGRAKRDGVDFGVTSVVDIGTSPTSVVARRQREAALIAALRSLPVELQVLIELHYWEDLSTRELADVLELAQGTVKSRLRKAKQLLEDALEKPDDLEQWIKDTRLDPIKADDVP